MDTSAYNKEGATIHFKNKATATFQGGSAVSNEVDIPKTVDFINKNGTYEAGSKIKWTITVNNNKLSIPDAKIIDKIPYGLSLDTDTIELDGASISMGGKLTYTGNPATAGATGTLTCNLGDINESHKLVYYTTVTDPDAYNSNTPKTYTNEASFTGTGVPNDTKAHDDVGVPTSVILKEGDGYDRSTHFITWKITVNSNKISIKNAVVSDDILKKQKFVDGSFKVNGSVPTSGFSYTPADDNDSDKTGSFTYTFPTTPITNTYIITYQTEVTDNTYYAANNTTGKDLTNTAELQGSNIPNSTSTGKQKVVSEVIKKSNTGYDYLTREATWTIVVNQNKMSMKNAYITDIIGEYQEFVPGSVEINNASATLGTSATQKDAYYFDTETKTLRYNFANEISKQQTITFKTRIPEDKISYFYQNGDKQLSNTAKLIGEDIPSANTSSTATKTVSNILVSKTAKYENGKDFIPWEVVINQNQIPIQNAVLEDTLQEGLALDTESVQLFELNVASDGKYTVGNEVTLDASNVKYNGVTRLFEFSFNKTIDKAYMLKFNTDVDEQHRNSSFTNTIKFKGSHGTQQGTSGNIQVSYQTGGAGASGSNGSITIKKVDQDNNTKLLQGAVFELLDKDGNLLKVSSPTDSNGTAIFNKLKYRTFTVREKTPPTGYVKSNGTYTFTLKNEDGSRDISYQFENKKIKGNIEFTKLNKAGGMPLPGAIFTLYSASDSTFSSPISTAKSNASGLVSFQDVEYGNYIIKETTAPEGYLLSNGIINATVVEDGATVHLSSFVNDTIKGSIKIMKKDALTGTLLSKAEFVLYTENGVLFDKKETDSNGVIVFSDVPYGKYYFMETKAPEGYISSDIKQNVTVTGANEGTYEINNQPERSLLIEKVDADDDTIHLEGATFEVKDSKGVTVRVVTTDKDGKAMVEGLAPGEYIVVETKAPSDYQLSDIPEKTVTITAFSEITTPVKFADEKVRTLVIKKVDSKDASKELANAEFKITGPNDFSVTVKTNEEGKATVNGLSFGSYIITETKAPQGYQLAAEPKTIVVNDQSLIFTIDIGNDVYVPGPGPGPGGPTEGSGGTPTPAPTTTPTPVPTKTPSATPTPTATVSTTPAPTKMPSSTPAPAPSSKPTLTPTPTPKPIIEITPENTPKGGKVPVPEGSTASPGQKPDNGKITVDKDGKWTYAPEPGFTGKDEFTITVTHPDGKKEEVVVHIDVNKVPFGNPDNGKKGSDDNGKGVHIPKTGEKIPMAVLPVAVTGIVAGIIAFAGRKKKLRNSK